MRKIPEEMERMILEALQRGEMYKTIVDRTGVSKLRSEELREKTESAE